MKQIASLTIMILISCSTKKNIKEPELLSHLNYDKKDTNDQLKIAALISIECGTSNCDSILICYKDYFKYLNQGISFEKWKEVLNCAIGKAEKNDAQAHKLVLEYYDSPYVLKSTGTFDWAHRLRGEDAFEITLEYMRQSKGDEGEDISIGNAASIFYQTIIHMIIFKDGTRPYDFMVYESTKYPNVYSKMEYENWLTTEFIDILKKEIKEGRVVFKKYGE